MTNLIETSSLLIRLGVRSATISIPHSLFLVKYNVYVLYGRHKYVDKVYKQACDTFNPRPSEVICSTNYI